MHPVGHRRQHVCAVLGELGQRSLLRVGEGQQVAHLGERGLDRVDQSTGAILHALDDRVDQLAADLDELGGEVLNELPDGSEHLHDLAGQLPQGLADGHRHIDEHELQAVCEARPDRLHCANDRLEDHPQATKHLGDTVDSSLRVTGEDAHHDVEHTLQVLNPALKNLNDPVEHGLDPFPEEHAGSFDSLKGCSDGSAEWWAEIPERFDC